MGEMVPKFYGGVGEIGGNRVLVEEGSTRVFLDFGMSFKNHGLYFEEYLKPRYASTGIKDLLRLHVLHYLPGIYRRDLLKLIDKPSDDDHLLSAVLLSHIHLDHAALVSLIDERVPIICSEITEAYARALLKVGTRGLETEIPNYKRRPLMNVRDEPVERTFLVLRSGQEQKVGPMTVTPYAVDHSVLGATGYVLKTSNSTLVYTGDLRFHGGAMAEESKKFVEAAAGSNPDILVCEGTRVTPEPESEERAESSEELVRGKTINMIRASKGLIIGDFAFRDLTRLATFYRSAKDTGRVLVINKRDAYLIDTFNKLPSMPFRLPSLNDKSIMIYVERKGTGTYAERDYQKWERPYIEAPNAVRAEQIHDEQAKFLIHLTFFDVSELVDIDPAPGAVYIHSASEPHHEEQWIDLRRLENWLSFFKVERHHFHASGHATAADIQDLIAQVNPKKVYPIHTEHPEMFEQFHYNVKMPVLEPF